MSHDIDITDDEPRRVVSLSFINESSCWVFVHGEDEGDEKDGHFVRLTKEEALAAAKHIQEYYAI